MFQPSFHQTVPGAVRTSFPAGTQPSRADAAPETASPVFVLGLVLEGANIAITIPAPGGPEPGPSPLDTVVGLLPPALDTHIVASTSADLARYFAGLRSDGLPSGFKIIDLREHDDAAIAPLASALLGVRQSDPTSMRIYADAIGTIVAARFAETNPEPGSRKRRFCGQLPKWRMRRVVDYVDANLGEPITLGDLAAAAKLTRMHFAAQFRATTGLRPHEYLLRRRIAWAKELLADDDLTIVDIALTVGFQTQAHFTTVFRRFVGDTPYQWRRAQAAAREPIAPRRPSAYAHREGRQPAAMA